MDQNVNVKIKILINSLIEKKRVTIYFGLLPII